MVLKKKLWMLLLLLPVVSGCKEDPAYSTENPAQCTFEVVHYKELLHVVGNIGQFASIKKSAAKMTMKSAATTTDYNMLATQKYFAFGLGGFIVGTTIDQELRVYDLACPNCNRAQYRLNLSNDGFATCPNEKCRIKYNLNYNTFEVPEGCIHTSPKPLFRYKIVFDGTYMHIWN